MNYSQVGFDYSILEQAAGASFIEALMIICMVAFLIWNIVLSYEDVA